MFCRNIGAFQGEELSETLQDLDAREERAQAAEEPHIQEFIRREHKYVKNITVGSGITAAAFFGLLLSPGGFLLALGAALGGGGIVLGVVGYVSNVHSKCSIDCERYRIYSSRAKINTYKIDKRLVSEPLPSELEKVQLVFAKNFFAGLSGMPRDKAKHREAETQTESLPT